MSIEAMKQALEALEILARYENPETRIQVRKPKDGGPIVTMYPHKVALDAAQSLRQAIEQAEKQEPVAWRYLTRYPSQNVWTYCGSEPKTKPEREPLYTTPPQRKPLTDEEIDRLWSQSLADTEGETWLPLREFARAIEAAHGIKEDT